jgi:CheY-like chemotaxis protein
VTPVAFPTYAFLDCFRAISNLLSRNDTFPPECDHSLAPMSPLPQSPNLVLNAFQEEAISDLSLVRILVVDDFVDWQRCVCDHLQQNRRFHVVAVASDGLEAVQKAQELQPDLILLDIRLPHLDGIAAACQIRKVAPDSKILFLTQELDPAVAQAALSSGGDGYVLKSDATQELIAAMEAVLRGKRFVSARLTDRGF